MSITRTATTALTRRSFVTGALGVGLVPAAGLAVGTRAGRASAGEGTATGPDYDVIVIGAGGVGMTAAMSARDGGARVLPMEKMAAGGNTVCAEGGMNACCTKVQEAEGIEDSVELFANGTFEGGHELGDMELITSTCENSNAALERLEERGMYLTRLSTSGGASVKRIHRPEDGSTVGAYLVRHMCEQCEQRGDAAVTQMRADELLVDDSGTVCGVRACDLRTGAGVSYSAKAVIVAAGDFGANHEMLAQYRPELLNAVTTNQPGATGDGIVLARAIGADTVEIGQIQAHPTVEQGTATLLSEGIRDDGAVLVNKDGEHFVNELLTRDKVSAAEWEQPEGWAYAVFDKKVYDSNTSVENKFVSKGLALVADTLEELGSQMDVDADAFFETMAAYNDAIANGEDDPQGLEKAREPIVDAPFYAIKVAPGIHHTTGGLRINTATEVLDADGQTIPGLFAPGEMTGGIHGGNRLGGNAICDINVFGHQAAMGALSYLGIVAVVREELVEMTQVDGQFNQHATQHGATACTDCHRVDATPVLTCTQCHDEAVAPEGWLTWEEAQQQA